MTRYANPFGAFEIDSVPGQPQLAHCHSLFVRPEHRGKGHGLKLKLEQMQVLSGLGYDMGTCTVDAANTRQRSILKSAGWSLLSEFTNRKTGSTTQLWGWVVTPISAPA